MPFFLPNSSLALGDIFCMTESLKRCRLSSNYKIRNINLPLSILVKRVVCVRCKVRYVVLRRASCVECECRMAPEWRTWKLELRDHRENQNASFMAGSSHEHEGNLLQDTHI